MKPRRGVRLSISNRRYVFAAENVRKRVRQKELCCANTNLAQPSDVANDENVNPPGIEIGERVPRTNERVKGDLSK